MKRTRERNHDIDDPQQKTKKKRKKTEITIKEIRITNEVRASLLKLKVDLVKHQKVTLINDDKNKLTITCTEKNTQEGDQDDDVGT